MKKFKITFYLALLSVVSLNLPTVLAGEKLASIYSVDAGKIMIYAGDSVRSVPVGGSIDWHCQGNDGIYYITVKSESGTGVLYIGYIDFQSGDVSYEKKLPVTSDEYTVKKFMVAEGIAYLLAEPRSSAGTGRVLNRVNLNSMEVDRLPDVLDYHVDGRDLIVLSKSGSGIALIRNEISVPITLMGEGLLRISVVMDNRMVFVTNGDETEIVDVRAGRALYHYANNKEFLMPEEYNMLIQAEDIKVSEQDEREMVFYKVFIDGIESGRTDSGPLSLSREFHVKVDANKYHLIKLDRWVLNAAKGRYDRENNIRQPKTEHIYIPMNRIVKISIKFDGKNYHYEIMPVFK